MNTSPETVLLTGATGFIGSNLYPRLIEEGYEVLCATRNPESAREHAPDRNWIEFDVHEAGTIRSALEQTDVVFYLIHEMSSGAGYADREQSAATTFRNVAEESTLEKLIYLGGVAPPGEPSRHLKSRLRTGEILREGTFSAIELRAAMVIGPGSSSWQIVRDLAARLPFMILPRWTQSLSQPVYVEDVVEALVGAIDLRTDRNAWFDIPGPEKLSVEDILRRTAELMNNHPIKLHVPLLSPRLSSYWLRFVTRSNYSVARELVEGLKTNLLANDNQFWKLIDHEELVSFDDAVKWTLNTDEKPSFPVRQFEQLVQSSTKLFQYFSAESRLF